MFSFYCGTHQSEYVAREDCNSDRVHTPYCENVAYEARDVGPQVWSTKGLRRVEGRVKYLERRSKGPFQKHIHPALYTVKYQILGHMA